MGGATRAIAFGAKGREESRVDARRSGERLREGQGEQLARGLGRYLQINKALPTVELGLDVVQQPTTTIVLYTENRRPMANDIARWLNLPETAVKTQPKPSDSTPDIVIIIGKDFKIPGT